MERSQLPKARTSSAFVARPTLQWETSRQACRPFLRAVFRKESPHGAHEPTIDVAWYVACATARRPTPPSRLPNKNGTFEERLPAHLWIASLPGLTPEIAPRTYRQASCRET